MGGKQSILIDDAGFLYVGTGEHSVLRSRVPVGRADPTDSGHGSTIAAWQAGPTPFRQQTAFALQLGDPGLVSLVLYDVRGRIVSTLWESMQLGAGPHVATWRPGTELASGTYYYRLVAGRSTRTGQVTLIR